MLDNSADLFNVSTAWVMEKPFDERLKAKDQDFVTIYKRLQKALASLPDGKAFILPPPPIQGIGNAGGFQMQLELLGGSTDYQKLGNLTDQMIKAANSDPTLRNVLTTFKTSAPHVTLTVDRDRAQTLRVSVGDVFSTLTDYVGSTYVNQFNKYGLSFQVYVQAESHYRLKPDDLLEPLCPQPGRQHGAARRGRPPRLDGRPAAAHQLQSLSLLDDHRRSGARLQFRPVDGGDGGDRQADPAGGRLL